MTLKMTTAQVVETSVTVSNSSFQNYTHPDDHTTRTNRDGSCNIDDDDDEFDNDGEDGGVVGDDADDHIK